MPAPKAYIEVNDIERQFYQVILYYGTQKVLYDFSPKMIKNNKKEE